MKGTKRVLVNEAEDEVDNYEMQGKRLRQISELNEICDGKVGVASLEWHQMDQ